MGNKIKLKRLPVRTRDARTEPDLSRDRKKISKSDFCRNSETRESEVIDAGAPFGDER